MEAPRNIVVSGSRKESRDLPEMKVNAKSRAACARQNQPASWETAIMKVTGGLLFLFGFLTADAAFGVEYRWTFAMGAGSESAQNRAGSEIIIDCQSGNQFNIPKR